MEASVMAINIIRTTEIHTKFVQIQISVRSLTTANV